MNYDLDKVREECLRLMGWIRVHGRWMGRHPSPYWAPGWIVEARRRLRMARGESFDTLPKNESDTKWPDEWNAKDDTAILSILRGEQ